MSRIPGIVFDAPGRKVHLGGISAEPPKGMTRDKAGKKRK